MIALLIVSQLVFSFARTLNVRYTAKEMTWHAMATSALVKITWLVSSALGINAVLDLDFWMLIAYIASGLIGDYLSLKVKLK